MSIGIMFYHSKHDSLHKIIIFFMSNSKNLVVRDRRKKVTTRQEWIHIFCLFLLYHSGSLWFVMNVYLLIYFFNILRYQSLLCSRTQYRVLQTGSIYKISAVFRAFNYSYWIICHSLKILYNSLCLCIRTYWSFLFKCPFIFRPRHEFLFIPQVKVCGE